MASRGVLDFEIDGSSYLPHRDELMSRMFVAGAEALVTQFSDW